MVRKFADDEGPNLAGLIALTVFVPQFAWLGTVLLILAAVAMMVPEFISRYRRIQGQSPTAERYRDFMAAFGVKRTGRTMRKSSQDFTD